MIFSSWICKYGAAVGRVRQLTDVVKQLAAATVLHDEEDAQLAVDHLVQFADVLVGELLHGRDLQVDARQVHLVSRGGTQAVSRAKLISQSASVNTKTQLLSVKKLQT